MPRTNKDSRLEMLVKYYKGVEARLGNNYRRQTINLNGYCQSGLFVPSKLNEINLGISHLIEHRIIDTSSLVLDAGSGDGRVLASFGIHDMPSVGVEMEANLVSESRRHITALRRLGILNGAPIKIFEGDFSQQETYTSSGIRFGDIAIFFNYLDNSELIAIMIREHSPKGVIYVVTSPIAPLDYGPELKLKFSLPLTSSERMKKLTRGSYSNDDLAYKVNRFHVYVKNI